MYQLFGASRRDVPSHLTIPAVCMLYRNDQLHHTSHSHYIRLHNVRVREQHASLPSPFYLPTSYYSRLLFPTPCMFSFFFSFSIGRKILIVQITHSRKRNRGNGIYLLFYGEICIKAVILFKIYTEIVYEVCNARVIIDTNQ